MKKFFEIAKALKPEGAYRYRVIILCFLAASTFWFFNALNEDYSANVRYPLEFVYDTDKYVAVDALPEDIQLNVSGLGWNLLRNNLGIKVSPIQIPLDNPLEIKKISGSVMPAFLVDQLNEFDLNFVITDTLYIHLDKFEDRLLYVNIDSTTIDLESDFHLVSSVGLTPDTVRVSGPASVLADLPDTVTLTIPQDDIDEDYDEIIPVALNHPKARMLSRNPPTVNVSFNIDEFTSSSRLVSISDINFPENALLETGDITVDYVVSVDKASQVDPSEFEVVAEYATFNPSDSTVVPSLVRVPAIVNEASIDSISVKVIFNE
ncbi:MAG: hypothetical protein AAF519_15700 [Bacteroidota bacterium]